MVGTQVFLRMLLAFFIQTSYNCLEKIVMWTFDVIVIKQIILKTLDIHVANNVNLLYKKCNEKNVFCLTY